MALGYSPGGSSYPATTHNFVSYYNAHEPDVDDNNVPRYGRETLVGLFDTIGIRKPTHSIKFERFEKDRIYPKVKATNGGAGAIGAEVQFTLISGAQRTISQAEPYDTGGTAEGTGVPVNEKDEIMILPASGTTAAAGNYVHCLVTNVNPSAGTFEAQPLDDTEQIPNVSSAEEIVRLGGVMGEDDTLPQSFSFTSSRYSETLQIIGGRHSNSGTEKLQKVWFTEKNEQGVEVPKYMLKGESDAYVTFLKSVDLTSLMGREISNTSLFNKYNTNPITKATGLIPQMLDRGNTFNYSSGIGATIDDFYDYNVTLDKQKGSKNNMFLPGIELDQQMDQELHGKFVNGGISYGNFDFSEEKKVNLGFQTFRVGSYTYEKRKMDIFSDLQSLGADGYGFPKEGLILPMGSMTQTAGPEQGETVSVLRKRYLEDAATGENREMRVEHWDGFAQDADGKDREEVRYLTHCGFELLAANQTGYVKPA